MKRATPRQVTRRWKGLPVKDAKAGLLIFVSNEDVQTAVPGDSSNCAASRACQRLYESTGVEFFHTVAYVDLPDPESDNPTERVVLRFILDRKTAGMIEELDGGGQPDAGGYWLRAPGKKERLEAMRIASQNHRARIKEAKVQGEIYIPNPRFQTQQRKGQPVPGMSGYVRSGTGQVQMTRTDDPGHG